jgi:hypothetical protein
MSSTDDLHSEHNKYNGFYRARVTEVDCKENGIANAFGGIRVFIPDIHRNEIDKNVDDKKSGILAYPACSGPLGGYNIDDPDKTCYYASSFIVPLPGSYVFVFFEGGNIDQAYYMSSWMGKQSQQNEKDINSPILSPPENRDVDEPHKVYTLLKSYDGRAIIVCDSKDQARVEITGKKRNMNDSDGPQGDSKSVYQIDTNMTTILLDERDGKEKLLIRSYKGDFINFDIENRKLYIEMEDDISIKTNGKFTLEAKEDIDIKTNANMTVQTSDNFHIKSGADFNVQSEGQGNFKTGGSMQLQAEGTQSLKAGGVIGVDGSLTLIQQGAAQPAQGADSATPIRPIGTRNY